MNKLRIAEIATLILSVVIFAIAMIIGQQSGSGYMALRLLSQFVVLGIVAIVLFVIFLVLAIIDIVKHVKK